MGLRATCAAILLAAAVPAAAQDLSDLQIEKVASGFRFTEGPVWSRDGFLIFSDIPAGKILEMAPPTAPREKAKVAQLRDNSGGANGNALDSQGRLYTCEGHARRVTRRDRKGKIEILADAWEGRHFNAPNDVIVRHDGHVYFTDPAFGSANDSRELDFYGIFHITPKGELSVVAKWKTRPNGITVAPDGGTLYVADSDRHTVAAFSLDRSGNATNQRDFLSGIDGVPNGLRTDSKGDLYVAANSVDIYSPEGKKLGAIPVGETPSNCAWGGEDFSTLYITAQSSIYRTDIKVKGSVQY